MKHFFRNSFGVDHHVAGAKSRVICLDLSKKENQQLVSQWAASDLCLWTHFGVPCGTASKARCIRMSKKKHGPPPLRSHRFPLGLPTLKGSNLARVRAANNLYSFTMSLIKKLDRLGKIWTLENQFSSLLWETPYWVSVREEISPFVIELDYCMFGGKRRKHTAIATNCSSLVSLNRLCDQQHDHAPWTYEAGKFATSEEASYPPEFCKAMAVAVFQHLAKSFQWTDVHEKSKKLKVSALATIATGGQPNRYVPPVVSEFACIVCLDFCDLNALTTDTKRHTTSGLWLQADNTGTKVFLPEGSKVLRTAKSVIQGEKPFCIKVDIKPSKQISDAADLHNSPTRHWDLQQCVTRFNLRCRCQQLGKGSCKCKRINFEVFGEQAVFGIRWSPEDFIEQAIEIGHPSNIFSGLTEEVKNAVDVVATWHPAQVILLRKKWLHRWLQEAPKLERKDADIKANASQERLAILKSKKLALLDAMLEEEKYPDKSIAGDILRGFDLVGSIPSSEVLPKKFSPATISVQELETSAMKSREALRHMTRSSGSRELDCKLWDKTQDELAKGWLVGPIEWHSLPQRAVVSRRFPVEQSGKVRPIDDYSQSQVNMTIFSEETASVDSIDYVCSIMCLLMRRLGDGGNDTNIVARSLDLSSAYRQLTVAESSKDYAHIAVFDPHQKKPVVYRQVAMPFGSKAAVNGFIRCARCLQWLAATCLAIPLSCYFDDYILTATPQLAENTEASMTILLTMLGWAFDRTGPKSDSFSHMVQALGVVFHLTDSVHGMINISNTDKRLTEILELLDETLERNTLTVKQAQVLRGRLAFSDAFIFGRAGKSALQEISRHAFAKPFVKDIGIVLEHRLLQLANRLKAGGPRCISSRLATSWFVFSDASFERDNEGGLGAVLVAPNGDCVSWFSFIMNEDLLLPLLSKGGETIIGELETAAVAMAINLWSRTLTSQHVVFFIDNDGAKYALIRGYSKSNMITRLCDFSCEILDDAVILPWFTRIPSASNIADFPSRGVQHSMLCESHRISHDEVQRSWYMITKRVEGHS